MEQSREREGRVTLGNWKRLLKLHFIVRMLRKDGTFRYTVYKEKYKKLITEIGFEVIRLLGKTWRKKSKEFRASSLSDDPGNDDVSTLSQEEDDDATVAVSNRAKDKTNHDWKEEEDAPLKIAATDGEPPLVLVSIPVHNEPTQISVSDSVPDVALKSTNKNEGADVGAEALPSIKLVGHMLDVGLESTERGKHHPE